MMSASKGGGGSWKSGRSKGGCEIVIVIADPNADKGEGVKNPKNLRTSYLEAPFSKWLLVTPENGIPTTLWLANSGISVRTRSNLGRQMLCVDVFAPSHESKK